MMSEPFTTTTEVRNGTCGSCSSSIVERKCIGMYGSTSWLVDRHDAPCGLPCFGAGVGIKVYRSNQFHGGKKPCPACGATRPTLE